MAMVQPKSQRLRLWITHIFMLCFIALIMFPLLMVIAISLRSGNFATGSLIPETSPRSLAAGARLQRHPRRRQRDAAAVPGAAVAVELHQDRGDHRHRHRDAIHHLRLRLRPHAFSWQEHAAEKHADLPDVPGGAVAGGAVRPVRSLWASTFRLSA